MLIVDKHAFQGTFHSIACPHQKHDSKSTCEGNTHTSSFESCSKSQSDNYGGCSFVLSLLMVLMPSSARPEGGPGPEGTLGFKGLRDIAMGLCGKIQKNCS